MKEPRVYKNSVGVIAAIAFVFVVMIINLAIGVTVDMYVGILLVCVSVIILPALIIPMLAKVTITDDEISAKNLFGERTVRWTEITSVSGRGRNIKLHGDGTAVSIAPQLPGYEEVIEIIGEKRADLFVPTDDTTMRRSFFSILGTFVTLLLLASIGILSFNVMEFSSDTFVSLAILALFMGITLWFFFSEPQSITVENNTVRIKYILSSKEYSASEIASVVFTITTTRRGGKRHYINIITKDGKNVQLSNLNIGLPVAYLTLKNWHKKYS
jgi:hypothetical protein